MGKCNDTMVGYKTLVLGATMNPERYAFKAVHRLLVEDIEVVPMGIKKGDFNTGGDDTFYSLEEDVAGSN